MPHRNDLMFAARAFSGYEFFLRHEFFSAQAFHKVRVFRRKEFSLSEFFSRLLSFPLDM